MTKRSPKTPKEKAFACEYIKTGNATEAASRVYHAKNRDTARNIGSQNVAKLSFDHFFDEVGLDNSSLSQLLADATKATKLNYQQEIPDWQTRLKAIELILKLKGTFLELEHREEDRKRALEEAPQTQEEEDAWFSLMQRFQEVRNRRNATAGALTNEG